MNRPNPRRPRRPPSLKQLEAFLAIEATRNLTVAAAQLNVSQPALSRTLRLLEEQLGQALFVRTTRAIDLAPAGVRLLPVAKRLVGEFHDAFAGLDPSFEVPGSRVVLATLSAVGPLLPRAISEFARRRPNSTVRLLGQPEQQVIEAVREGVADFGLVTRPVPADWFVFAELVQDDYVLLCRRDDPLARRKTVPWSALVHQRLIQTSSAGSTRVVTDRVFLELGLPVPSTLEVDHLAIIGALVGEGLGVSVVGRGALNIFEGTHLTCVPLAAPRIRRTLGSIRRRGVLLAPAAQALHAILHELAAGGDPG